VSRASLFYVNHLFAQADFLKISIYSEQFKRAYNI